MVIENQKRYAQWYKLVEDQESSGLSQKEFFSFLLCEQWKVSGKTKSQFCKEHKIALASL